MIVIASKEGQFANRIVHFSHILSFCKFHNIKLVHPHFREYQELFPNLKASRQVSFPENSFFKDRLVKLFLVFIRVLLKLKVRNLGLLEIICYDRYDQEAPAFDLSKEEVEKKAKNKILVLYGWLFRDPENFNREEEYIKKTFSIREEYGSRANQLMADVRKNCDVAVGVHIRRGDYKRFENGRWYYEDDVYREKLIALEAQLQPATGNKRVAFILCSNENLDPGNYAGLKVFHFREHFAVDFLLLSKSDYIIGPPSTFSALASFYNKAPLQFIQHKEQQIDLKNFNVWHQL